MNRHWPARKTDKIYDVLTDAKVNTVYHRDRSRIIHSSAFRRLQAKTQIIALGESDFYRTRLTHTLEVAQICTGITLALQEKFNDHTEFMQTLAPMFLIEAIGLGHDLGHPPFGHDGERALNECMSAVGGFEGNGQTLRIVSKLGEYSFNDGFALSRRALLGLIKYPVLYRDAYNAQDTGKNPPKCILDSESELFEWILNPLSISDQQHFRSINKIQAERHYRSLYKSLDCSIMELADDIAYGVHDFEDALELELISLQEWDEEVLPRLEKLTSCPLVQESGKTHREFYRRNLFSHIERERKHAISILVGYFIQKIHYKENNHFESPLLRYNAVLEHEAEQCLAVLKDFIFNNVIKRLQVKTLEYKARKIIKDLFSVYTENPTFMPDAYLKRYEQEGNNPRAICDYLSGMTDAYASKQYQRLFMPEIGSIYDR